MCHATLHVARSRHTALCHITLHHECVCRAHRYDAYRASSDFIREHVFPGGHLPCIGACVEAARGTGLSLHATTDIGPHYAITLREWRRRCVVCVCVCRYVTSYAQQNA